MVPRIYALGYPVTKVPWAIAAPELCVAHKYSCDTADQDRRRAETSRDFLGRVDTVVHEPNERSGGRCGATSANGGVGVVRIGSAGRVDVVSLAAHDDARD